MSKVQFPISLGSNKQMRQVLGVSFKYFQLILDKFTAILTENIYDHYFEQPYRQRRLGGGRKPILATATEKLAYCLYYLRNYPTFQVLGHHFNMSPSTAHDNVSRYLPMIKQSLQELGVMPDHDFEDDAALSAYLKKKVLVH